MLKKFTKVVLAFVLAVSCFTFTKAHAAEGNLALNKTCVASDIEADSVRASNATDGDSESRSSRWGSNVNDGPNWIYVDLGSTQSIQTIKIFWENRKATAYSIDVATTSTAPEASSSEWKSVMESNDRPSVVDETIVLNQPVQARFVRLYIDSHTAEDPDSGGIWNSVSIYELEVYAGKIKESESAQSLLNAIKLDAVTKDSKKLSYTLPESENYDVFYNGTDYEQVIGADGTIYQPLVDTSVKASFKAISKTNAKDYKFIEFEVVVPGKYTQSASDNAMPKVLPELREWKGNSGNYTLTTSTKVIYSDDSLAKAAKAFVEDFKDESGMTLEVVKGNKAEAKKGDIFFELVDESHGLDKEGYYLDIQDVVTIQAEETTGAYWATRTMLQILKGNNNTSMPKGITRDYPLYEVRGITLDVGRKTFTLDFLKQLVKEMSYYKMSDFQVHLADNYIFIEDYKTLEEKFNAYSGFRLESDIKEGGANGLYKADLTSKDVWYSKDDFRDFIKESRDLGINIVPEIDTPAHSLSITKVRPDLRKGDSGRDPDHLNLTTKYDESLDFVKQIFNEYIGGSNPVFDELTTVHVGADEYFSNSVEFRNYANDMMDFVRDSGRTVRIWGSWSEAKEGAALKTENAQVNIWNYGYADYSEMYEAGFGLIDINDGQFYIVPNAGYYYDYLNNSVCYNDALNAAGNDYIPAGDKQVLGGQFGIWNDMVDAKENGVSEYDVYDRISNSLGIFACNAWGKGNKTLAEVEAIYAELGDAPNTNFDYEVESKTDSVLNLDMDSMKDSSGNEYDLSSLTNASLTKIDEKQALKLNGGKSYATINGLETAGLAYDLRVKVKRSDASNEEQILFESPYGTIKAVQNETGKVGFSRENRDYSFNYTLPVNVWVELEFKTQQNQVALYVDGILVDTLGDGETVVGRPLLATMMLPLAKIGSETSSFHGYVDDVRVDKDATFASTTKLDYAIMNAIVTSKDKSSETLVDLIQQAQAVVKAGNASSEVIDKLVADITNELESLEVVKADFTKLKAYLDIAEQDLNLFTKESVTYLELVLAQVDIDFVNANQAVLDAYTVMLADAIKALELKDKMDANYADLSDAKITASSYQNDGSYPSNVADGNPSTMWHTDWSATTMPHYLQVELANVQNVNGLIFTPRSGCGNGTPSKYSIMVSKDGTNWTTVVDNRAVTCVDGENEFAFDACDAKFIRLVLNAAKNNNGSCAELKVRLANVEADIEGLNEMIASAYNIDKGIYSDASYQSLQDLIKEGEALAEKENANATQVNQMILALAKAKKALTINDDLLPKPVVNKERLETLIDDTKAYQESVYTSNSYQGLKDAISKANEVIANSNASQSDVDNVVKSIKKAISTLVVKGDKTQLVQAIDDANTYQESVYTSDSYQALKDAISKANEVITNENAIQVQVDDATKAIKDAIANLKKAEVKPEYKGYDDVKVGEWFYEMVKEASIRGLMGADGGGTKFNPDGNITRAMVATVLYRMAGTPNVTYEARFSDVSNGEWYTKAIIWASDNKVVNGYANGSFGPDDNITRQDFAIMLRNYAKAKGLDTKTSQSLDAFKDADKVDGYAKSAIQWCVEKGLMSGSQQKDGVYLNPTNNATRAEGAKMFVQFDNLFKK